MKRSLMTFTLVGAIALAGCATPLTATQKGELEAYRAKGVAVEEKDPGTATALGILPGGGSFYTRNYALGAINLLLWPISILWDPISGRDGAERINYEATMEVQNQKRDAELKTLETKLMAKQISTEKYAMEKNRIERAYAPQL